MNNRKAKKEKQKIKARRALIPPKVTRLSSMVDKDSYDDIISLYKFIKGTNTYSLDDFILFKSIMYRIVVAQQEKYEEVSCFAPRKVWATPHNYFDRLCEGRRYKKSQKALIDWLLENYKKANFHAFGFSYDKDYGKFL